jgi:hypothetical protein
MLFSLIRLAFLMLKLSYQKWRERATGWRVMAGKPLNNVLPGRRIIRVSKISMGGTNLNVTEI